MCRFSNKREETISACLVFGHPRDEGGWVLGVLLCSMQKTQHLHVYHHLFGFSPGGLGCDGQSCYFRGSAAFGAVGEDNRGGSLELVGACPRFACASSKWTVWGSGCATIKVAFYNHLGHFQVLK